MSIEKEPESTTPALINFICGTLCGSGLDATTTATADTTATAATLHL